MTEEQFKFQLDRLVNSFGSKHFDLERIDLIRNEVLWMDLGLFSSIVSSFLSSMRSAPLPKDFREVSLKEKAKRTSSPVVKDGTKNEWPESLETLLEWKYPGATSAVDALEVERLKLRAKKALK